MRAGPEKVRTTPYIPKCTSAKEVQSKIVDQRNTLAHWQEPKVQTSNR